ncbi:MAG TPA: recombinase family protein [Tepidisphaeraceae bacterium]|nr:recombinase family protein [Tepidisphaeraceae bacterium]
MLEIGRVSTEDQDINNIEAGYQYAERVLKDIWDGESVIRRLGEQASGLLIERKTILEALRLIEEGWPDVVLMEDASKSYRNPRYLIGFFQDCVDAGVRVIAPGDSIDTFDENWEVALQTAALRHGLHIPDTRRRIRRTASQSFERGGMVGRIRFGYRKLTEKEADSGTFGPRGLRLAKVPATTPIFDAMRQMIAKSLVPGEQPCGGTELARWLNDEGPDGKGVPPGPYVKSGKWTDHIVLNLLRDPLLYGLRQYPKVKHQTLFKTGKHRRSKNATPQQMYYVELAHMTQEQWEQMNKALDEIGHQAKAVQRAGVNSPRYRVATRDTVTGLQHATCIACKDLMYPVGQEQLKCCNGLIHETGGCWNHVQVPLKLLRAAMVDTLLARLERVPKSRRVMMEAAWHEVQKARHSEGGELEAIDAELAELRQQEENLTSAVATRGGKLEVLLKRLKTLAKSIKEAEQRRQEVATRIKEERFPKTLEQLEIDPRAVLLELADTSFKFAALLRRVFTSVVIQPVQALDSGQVHPRVLLTLDLSVLSPQKQESPVQLDPPVAVDVFEPPVHIRHLPALLEKKAALLAQHKKASLSVLAAELKINRMTVKRALGYWKLMQAEGLTEPYRVLTAAPLNASRWKRSAKRSQRSAAA